LALPDCLGVLTGSQCGVFIKTCSGVVFIHLPRLEQSSRGWTCGGTGLAPGS
jgi:hypothetical protein